MVDGFLALSVDNARSWNDNPAASAVRLAASKIATGALKLLIDIPTSLLTLDIERTMSLRARARLFSVLPATQLRVCYTAFGRLRFATAKHPSRQLKT